MTTLLLAIATLLIGYPAPPAQDPKSEITETEAVEFARKIERDQAEGREAAFDDAVDYEGLVADASAGLDLKPKEKTDFTAGFRSGSMGKAISAAQGYSYTFLRSRQVEGRHVLTFRLWSEGLNYHELHIRKTPRGLRIVDLFNYTSGEWTGTLVRRALMAQVATDPARRAKVPDWASDWMKNMSRIQEFAEEARSGKAEKALASFDAFPESLRTNRMIQSIRVLAAARASDEALVKASDEYARLFPGDACRDIVCLDALIIRKDFARAQESVDRIDKAVGGDGFLDLIRGRLHLLRGKFAEARDAAHKVIKNLPPLADPHWLLVEITLKEKKFGETVERLNALEKALEARVRPESLEADPEYAEFVKSPEYRDWVKSRAPAK